MDAAAEAAKKAVRKLDNGADTMQDDDELVATADDASSKVARFTEHVQSLMNETQVERCVCVCVCVVSC